jgi:Ca-activated chloride channel homolog
MLTIGQIASGTEAGDEPAAGGGFGALSTTRGNLPLRALDVRADIIALTAGIEVVQEFANPFDEPLEATYIFPLPDRAAFTALRFQADGRTIDGVLTERAQARREYDEAIRSGWRAAIAEEERPDVFTMRVGNILPGEKVVVRLSLTQPLPFEDGEATFRFPLVIAPRYIPGTPLPGAASGSGTQPDTDAVPDASRISPPVLLPGFPNPVRLGITARIDPAGLPVSQVRSSLHAVGRPTGQDGSTLITIEPGERLDRDFILRFAVAEADDIATSLVLRPDDPPGSGDGDDEWGTGTFMLTLVPPAASIEAADRDMVIVLDRSASMSGWKMVAARRAAARIVDTLGSSDRFAVLCFDNTVQEPPELAGRLVAGTDRNRFRAVEFLAAITARGGTEMLGALEQAAGLLADQARNRVLVLVTDGQVGNEDQILDNIGPRLTGARIHVVGIDQAVNAGFLSRLASVGRGRCELVESEDRLDAAMTRIHERIASPVVTGLSLSSADLALVDSAIAPSPLPGLFAGAAMTIFGRYRSLAEANASVTVSGLAGDGGAYKQTLTPVERSGASSGTPATALWARARLRDLEDSYACAAPGRDDVLEALEQQIVATSLRFGVVCRFTAFVAVDSRVVTGGGSPHRVTQPVDFPAGWEMAIPAPAAMDSRGGGRFAFTAGAPGQAPVPQPSAFRSAAAAGSSAAGPSGAALLRPAPTPGTGRAQRKRHAGMMPPGAQAPQTAERGSLPVPEWARTQVAGELAWLDSVPELSVAVLTRDLADLGSRLHGLLRWLSGARVEAPELGGLRELAAKLSGCDGRVMAKETLRALRAEAREVLRDFAGDAATGEPPRQFWKRAGGAG